MSKIKGFGTRAQRQSARNKWNRENQKVISIYFKKEDREIIDIDMEKIPGESKNKKLETLLAFYNKNK